jgi:dUTP pyrophosphatase
MNFELVMPSESDRLPNKEAQILLEKVMLLSEKYPLEKDKIWEKMWEVYSQVKSGIDIHSSMESVFAEWEHLSSRETPILKFTKLHPDAIAPSYAHPGDAGLDLYAVEEVCIHSGRTALVGTGIAIELPPGTEGQIRPRSGLALRNGVTVLNAPGTIDQGYRGELGVILINHGAADFWVKPGMRIAQLVIAPVLTVELAEAGLEDSDRGDGGFGSTGGMG